MHSGSIVMVVTDVVMPRMGGIELASATTGVAPDLPILFVTGYVEQSDALHESAAGTPVLLKPFSPDALLRAASSAIRSASALKSTASGIASATARTRRHPTRPGWPTCGSTAANGSPSLTMTRIESFSAVSGST